MRTWPRGVRLYEVQDVIKKSFAAILAGLLLTGCPVVPKQSVELSTTIGRDLATVHHAHVQLANLLFSRMRSDVNRFIDQVYAPFQIQAAMTRQKELADSPNPGDQRKSLLLAINSAFSSDGNQELQSRVLIGMGAFVTKLRIDIDSMRRELLAPLDTQQTEVIASIDRSYLQLHYSNSIVTGYLSSVVKVKETQSELLDAIGVDRNLGGELGDALSRVSGTLTTIVDNAERTDTTLTKALESVKTMKETIKAIAPVHN